MRIFLATIFSIAMVQPALCGTISDFIRLHDEPLGRGPTESQILGMQTGFLQANSFLKKNRKEAPLFCQPETLVLTADQLVDMLRRGVKEQPELNDSALSFALLTVMQHTFPCAETPG
jgi:hypothetical protein